MLDSLAQTVTLYAVALAGWAAITVVTGRRPAAFLVGAAVLQLGVVVAAVLDLVTAPAGPEPTTHLGYLVVSVALLPAAFGWAGRDHSRWGSATLALCCLCLAVVVVRLRQTVS